MAEKVRMRSKCLPDCFWKQHLELSTCTTWHPMIFAIRCLKIAIRIAYFFQRLECLPEWLSASVQGNRIHSAFAEEAVR